MDKRIILTIQYDDGTEEKREILTIFKADNGRDYAALLPFNDESKNIQASSNIEIVRVRIYQNEEMEEDYAIESITTEVESQTAKEAFERLIADKNNSPSIEELLTLSFKNERGEFEDWKVVDVFEHNKRKYIALIPISQVDVTNIDIYLMRLELTISGGIEGCKVFSIPSDLEYDEVASIFEKRISEVKYT